MIQLKQMMEQLAVRASRLGLTQAAWAERAGIRQETLSRISKRASCDLASLQALAQVVGAAVVLVDAPLPETTDDGRFPRHFDREFEARLIDFCVESDFHPLRWRAMGPAFFMAGLAVLLAGVRTLERRRYLDLGENLHAGISQVEVFDLWLQGSPLRPSRFIPMLVSDLKSAA